MAKKKSKKEKDEKKEVEKHEDEESKEEDNKVGGLLSNTKLIYAVIILAVLGFIGWQVKGYFVAATVNNSPITRLELIEELETQYGAEVLDGLITRKLVEQAAAEQGISVTEEEINSQINEIRTTIEGQGSTLEDELATQGQTQESLREGVRLTIIVEKLFSEDIEVSEEDVREAFEQNQQFYSEETTFEDVRGQLREQILQQQLSGRFSEWLQNRRDQANINRFVSF